MWIYDFAFCCEFRKMSQIHVFRLLQYYIGGVIEIYYNITWGGGLPNLLQYYNGGGSLGTPNLYYVIYGRPLMVASPLITTIGLLYGGDPDNDTRPAFIQRLANGMVKDQVRLEKV